MMSSLTPKLAPKSTSKLARPTGLAQARASPTPTTNRSQGECHRYYMIVLHSLCLIFLAWWRNFGQSYRAMDANSVTLYLCYHEYTWPNIRIQMPCHCFVQFLIFL